MTVTLPLARRRSSRPRDSQRSRCYEAEHRARCSISGREFASLAEVKEFVDSVLASEWWREHVGPTDRVVLVERDCGQTSAGRYLLTRRGRDTWVEKRLNIVLSRRSWSWSDWTALHELAHIGRFALTKPDAEAGHSPEWAGLLLGLVREFMGRRQYETLRELFDARRARYVMPANGRAP